MREIKFRAFHKERKVMVHFDIKTITKTPYPGFYYTEDLDGFYCELDDPNLYTDLMQYTGLKDKNGNEVYEGDIVTDASRISTQIIFEKSSFIALSIDGVKDLLGENNEVFEVIGNIYENPELLEAKV